MSITDTTRLLDAIRDEGLDGWLFFGFHHRDPLAERILGLDGTTTNSRPWIYALPASGRALKIVHFIEKGELDSLPGDALVYSSRDEYLAALGRIPKGKAARWAVQISDRLPVVSFLDAGTAELLRNAGLALESSAALVQRVAGLLDEAGIASHQRAAEGLYDIVDEAWNFVISRRAAGKTITEGAVRALILDGMERRGLQTDHPPIVAAGANAGDPHYDFDGDGAVFAEGDVVQFDLWAKEKTPLAIYADISWVGYLGEAVNERYAAAWTDLKAARDGAVSFMEAELAAGRRPAGADVDAEVRRLLTERGRASALRHRTGHGIDTEVHGSGANLDSVEFPDQRLLLDGACFSVEPGLYYDDFGLRTEIDCYIRDGELRVSGRTPQRDFLVCPGTSR